MKYEDNAVYRVTGPRGEQFALRIIVAEGEGQAQLLSELLWLLALRRDTDLLVPEPIPTVDGALVVPLELESLPTTLCCLLRWVPGRALHRGPTRAALTLAGGATARLHRHADRWAPPPGFARPRYDLGWLFGPTSALTSPRDSPLLDDRGQAVVAAAGKRLQTEVTALGTGADVFGLLHADLNLGNLVYQDGRIGIIDFDDSGWGYYLYDIATTLCSLRRSVRHQPREAMLREAYLTGYDCVRPLPGRLATLLPTFMALRELVIMTFILESRNLKVRQWGAARVAEAVDSLDAYLRDRPPFVPVNSG